MSYSYPNFEPVCCSVSGCNCCFLTCIQVSQETDILPSCISFSLGWFWSLSPVQCYKSLSIVLQALCLPDLQNIRAGSHYFLHGVFQTQRSNPHLLHYRQILYRRATREAPRYLWVFSRVHENAWDLEKKLPALEHEIFKKSNLTFK